MNEETQYTDEDILESIQSGDPALYNKVLKFLYKKPALNLAIKKVVNIYGLDPSSEAAWILNDSLMAFYESVVDYIFDLSKSSVSTYIVAVAKKIAFTYKRSQDRSAARMIKLSTFDPNNPLNESSTFSKGEQKYLGERERAFKIALQAMGKRCEETLKHYANGYKVSEIAEKIGLTFDNVAIFV